MIRTPDATPQSGVVSPAAFRAALVFSHHPPARRAADGRAVGRLPGGRRAAATDKTGPGDAFATVTDDNGTTVAISAKPRRIVSTAPANTETLFALGLGDRVVGVTSLDDYPAEVADLPKVGDYTANAEAITALSPDLVVGYSGNEEALAPIAAAGTPVLILNPTDLGGHLRRHHHHRDGDRATEDEAADLIESMKAQMTQITTAAKATGEPPSVFYALDNTLYTCGPGSFVDQLLTLANTTNVGSLPKADGTPADAYPSSRPSNLWRATLTFILLRHLPIPAPTSSPATPASRDSPR